jgi:hypothetical protein
MVKTIKLDKNFYITTISIIIIILLVSYLFYKQNLQNKCENDKEIINIKIKNLETTIKNVEETTNSPNIYNNTQPMMMQQPQQQQAPLQNPYNPNINMDPKTINSLDRVYNPLRYPYKSDYFYDQKWYPNLELPFQVIGCGGRNKPCLGGTQVPIYNPPTPIDISDNNIAPVYISTRGPLGQPQQLGILYKVYGDENDVYPLFGRKKYPNDNKYEYYTMMGNYGVKVPIVTKNRNDELGTNDIVFVKGRKDPYTVTIYKSDYPSYIPYF